MFSFFGWNRRVRKLRKEWDRAREKALKKHGAVKKEALERLDVIEGNLRTLEEQQVSGVVRARLAKDAEISLAEVKAIMKASEGELEQMKSQRS